MFSASRIGLWISCNRRAGWKYICGYPEGENPSAALGKRVHKVLEDNKRLGLLPDRTTQEGAIAAEALPFTKEYTYEGPDGPVQLEGHIFVDGRHKWQGYKDLSAPGTVIDYKTSSDPRKWGKTAGDLSPIRRRCSTRITTTLAPRRMRQKLRCVGSTSRASPLTAATT